MGKDWTIKEAAVCKENNLLTSTYKKHSEIPYFFRGCCHGLLCCNNRQTALGALHKLLSIPQNRMYHEVTGDIICPSMVQGIDHLRDPRLNKVS
jgi:hypothetical protein